MTSTSFLPEGTLLGLGLGLAAWILTYLLHSTVLFAGASLVAKGLARPADEELLWRAVLLAGLLTTTVDQLAQPPLGEPPAPITALAAAAPPETMNPETTASGARTPEAQAPAPLTLPAETFQAAGQTLPGRAAAAFLALAALFFWTRPTIAWWRFKKRWATRRVLGDEAPRQILDDLLMRAQSSRQIELAVSPGTFAPFAFGAGKPTICLPERAMSLSRREMTGLLAHELAHLERRDPAWRFSTAWLEDLLFFQPLHRLTGRRLGQLAELLSDDWASRVSSPRAVASSLAAVATWLPTATRVPCAAATPMAADGSSLTHRVSRLATGRATSGLSRSRRALVISLTALSLPLAALPGVSAEDRRPGPPAAAHGEGSSDAASPSGAQCDSRPTLLRFSPLRFTDYSDAFPRVAWMGPAKASARAILKIDAFGLVQDLQFIHYDMDFETGYDLEFAMRSAVFEPCLRDGEPVEFERTLGFFFERSGKNLGVKVEGFSDADFESLKRP